MLMCVPEGHSTNLRSDDNDPSGRLSCPAVAAATLSLWKSHLLLLSGALSSCCPTVAVAATATRGSSQLLLRSGATGDDNLDGRRVAHVAHRGVDPWLSSTGPGGNRDYVPLAGKDTIFLFCHLVCRFQNEDRINIHGA